MAREGYYLFQGDGTTCGGKITEGAEDTLFNGRALALEGHAVTCGKHPGKFRICGGMGDTHETEGVIRQWAGSLDSYSSCPCKSRFIPLDHENTYEYNCNAGLAAERARTAEPGTAQEEQPAQHARTVKTPQPEKKPGIDAGFVILPYGGTTDAWQRLLFTENPPAGARELFAGLNGADERYRAGSIMLVVDPDKQDEEQIAHLKAAKARVDAALAPLSIRQANFLYQHRDTVAMFAAISSTASDAAGYAGQVTEAAKGYFGRIEKILSQIQQAYQSQYITRGTLIGEQFFVERQRLLGQLDSVLKMFMKQRFMFTEYTDLKSTLGLSSKSITHRWNETGVGDIEGYATHIEKMAKYVKLMESAGKVGIWLSAFDTAAQITEACTTGRECEKTAFTSVGEFSGSLIGGAIAGKIAGTAAANTVCAIVLGAATIEAGGAGALLCTLGVNGAIAYGSDKATSAFGGFLGESLYEVTGNDH
ncbi:PAAR domain-containing protein [Pantoea sp. C2G6]|uniref:PAAR domain-containing protein n=1 Tax=Pantoea sp. C2G6 TaxID=3243084 RepID=UPI003ED97A3A